MKYILFFITFWSFSVYSQDIITTKKGEDIEAKVLEVNVNEVKYKKYNNPQGPIYLLLKSDILLIRYENGTKDIFHEEEKNITEISSVQKDRITIVDNRYTINGKSLDNRTFKSILYQDTEAYSVFKKSQRYATGTVIYSSVSFGLSVTSLIMLTKNMLNNKGNETNTDYLYPLLGGAGMLIPATILKNKTLKYRAQAVDKYNNNLQTKKVSIIPVFGGNRAGVVIQF
jgi:hypothetical protein